MPDTAAWDGNGSNTVATQGGPRLRSVTAPTNTAPTNTASTNTAPTGAATPAAAGPPVPATPVAASTVVTPAPWRRLLVERVALTDALILACAAIVSLMLRFGAATGPHGGKYALPTVAIAVGWWLLLNGAGSRSPDVLGTGSEEYRRITGPTLLLFGSVAIVSLLFKFDTSRGFLALLFPLGLLGLLLGRRIWRTWLQHERAHGRCMSEALVIGGPRAAADIAGWLHRNPGAGLRTGAVWIPDRSQATREYLDVDHQLIPVIGTGVTFDDALISSGADTVIVTDTEHLGGHGLKNLNWRLEAAGVKLLVSPNVFDVTGSRLHLTDLDNMPMLSIDKPNYAEASAWPKLIFDRAGAALLLTVLSPLLMATALAVKLTSPGPIFYRQERIGLAGRPFSIVKFRSMHAGADRHLQSLLTAQGDLGVPMSKVRTDPRLTPIGGFIRRFSIDELPQLVNVLLGQMSLVGPRPQRRFEVELYDEVADRRLLVRPGMTGLWQVSGRSDLSWEEAVRLDTFYVENWSMIGDLRILWRTVEAVFSSDGAY